MPQKSEKSKSSKGGSLYTDATNLAVPFGLLLAAHGVGYLSNKLSGKKTAKKQSGGDAKKSSKKATKKTK